MRQCAWFESKRKSWSAVAGQCWIAALNDKWFSFTIRGNNAVKSTVVIKAIPCERAEVPCRAWSFIWRECDENFSVVCANQNIHIDVCLKPRNDRRITSNPRLALFIDCWIIRVQRSITPSDDFRECRSAIRSSRTSRSHWWRFTNWLNDDRRSKGMITLHELQPCSAVERVDARNDFEEIHSPLNIFGHSQDFSISIDEHQRQ